MVPANHTHGSQFPGVWWLLLLGIWTLSGAFIAALALGWLAWSPTVPTFHLFFSDFQHMKIWLATGALVLAGAQLLWAARIYNLLRFPPGGRFYAHVHRWAGRLALLLTLPIAYHCIILVGLTPIDMRVLGHMILGAFFYGVVATKVFLVRWTARAGWLVPLAGGVLFVMLLGLWLTSVPWFVSIYGLSR